VDAKLRFFYSEIKTWLDDGIHLFLADNGNVGIGCYNPQYHLDVNGTIRGKEVRVELAGCDFVFDKGYELLTLKQRKAKVLLEKHLPNIAPAFAMQQGQDLGTFTLGLLQNLEEHEHYLYQQEEKNEKQDDEIKKIKDENTELKMQLDILKKQIAELKQK
jgi:hypothetical protein